MSTRPTGLLGIAHCHFAVHLQSGERVFRWRRLLIFAIASVVIGVLLVAKLGAPAGDKLSLIVAVLAVVSAVLMGLLPLAHSILGQANTERKYTEGERPLAQQELDRVQTLQDLHAAISWAVILLVVGLAACAAIALLPTAPPTGRSGWMNWLERGLLVVMYSIMASTALTLFDVAKGVFEVMESHAESIKRRILGNITKGGNEETQE